MKQKSKKRDPLFYNFWYDFIKITGALPAWIWMRPNLYYPFGKPSKKGSLLVSCNHSTFVDPILVQLAFPFRRLNSLATKDLYQHKAAAVAFHHMHCIFTDKDNFSLKSFHEVVTRLQEGKLVLIFPEGRVNSNEDKTLLAFKSGAVLMAHKAGAPILPMYIQARKKWYQRYRIAIGRPIYVTELFGASPSMQAMSQVSDLLREKENELKTFLDSLSVKYV